MAVPLREEEEEEEEDGRRGERLHVSWTMERHGRSIRYTFVRLVARGSAWGRELRLN